MLALDRTKLFETFGQGIYNGNHLTKYYIRMEQGFLIGRVEQVRQDFKFIE